MNENNAKQSSEGLADIVYLAVKEDRANLALEIIRIKKLNPLISIDKEFITEYLSNYKKDLEQPEKDPEQNKKMYISLLELTQIINENDNRDYLIEEIKKL